MSKVILDGEIVNFEGPSPSSCSEVWSLLESHLGQSGILMDRFLVDGDLWSPGESGNQDSYHVIEVFTVTFEQNITNIVEALLKEGEALKELWMSGASKSLVKPWALFQSEAVRVLNETQSLAQSVGLLTEYFKQSNKSWSTSMDRLSEKFNVTLSSIMDAIEAEDCVAFSDLAATEFYVTLTEIYRLLASEVLPVLKGEKGDG